MRILVVYLSPQFPMRYAIADHLYAFRRYSKHHCFYFNALRPTVPDYLKNITWDAVIFHNTFLVRRGAWDYERICERLSFLKDQDCPKVVIAQDEHNQTDTLCAFIRDFGVSLVSTECPTDKEVDTAYKGHIPADVKLIKHLPGYVDDRRVRQMKKYWNNKRDIDIGYRSFAVRGRLGRLGILKWKIADEVEKHAAKFGLHTDISTSIKKTLYGFDWMRFLARCHYTLGVEGGSSVIDRDGTIYRYERANPDADFDEIETNCFAGQDGNFNYAIMSPRVFEAAMSRTCLIMVEGDYNGILKPDVHYIPIKKDFSNIEEVLGGLSDQERKTRMVEKTYQDLIASGQYAYDIFVRDCLSVLDGRPQSEGAQSKIRTNILYYINITDEAWERAKFYLRKHNPLYSLKELAKPYVKRTQGQAS
ncbi:MAG: hypothetical protein ACN2B6_10185 [Rickettsiales bacterium]